MHSSITWKLFLQVPVSPVHFGCFEFDILADGVENNFGLIYWVVEFPFLNSAYGPPTCCFFLIFSHHSPCIYWKTVVDFAVHLFYLVFISDYRWSII